MHVLFPLEHQQVSLGVKAIFMAEKNSHITTLWSLFVEKSPEKTFPKAMKPSWKQRAERLDSSHKFIFSHPGTQQIHDIFSPTKNQKPLTN